MRLRAPDSSRRDAIPAGILAAILCAAPALAQPAPPNPLLPAKQLLELYNRVLQLMESTTLATPELSRAGAPIGENAKQAFINVQKTPASSEFNYAFLVNLRAYLALADSVPKPFPFPDEARQQFAELRDDLNRIESHFRAMIGREDHQIRDPDRDNLKRYFDADEKTPPPIPGKPRVVFLGDSITDGWRLNEYFPDQDFINRGISGQITGQMLGRMKQDVIDLKPVAVLILAGTNDLARGTLPVPVENDYLMIADLADHYHIKVIFASVLPVSDYHKDVNPAYEQTKIRPPIYIHALNEWLQSFCSQRNYTYLDYYSAMVDKNGAMQADLADDGLHPNSKGYRIMAPLAQAAIQRTVASGPMQHEQKRHRLFSVGK